MNATETSSTIRRRHRALLTAAWTLIDGASPGDGDHAVVANGDLEALIRAVCELEAVPEAFATMSAS